VRYGNSPSIIVRDTPVIEIVELFDNVDVIRINLLCRVLISSSAFLLLEVFKIFMDLFSVFKIEWRAELGGAKLVQASHLQGVGDAQKPVFT